MNAKKNPECLEKKPDLNRYLLSSDVSFHEYVWDRFQEFTKSLSKEENVDKILKIDLINTLLLLTKADVIQAIRLFVNDEYVVQLLTSLINIPLLGKTGDEILLNKIPKSAIPHTGELGIWLYNIVLMVYWDQEFLFRFPDIIMTRFIHEVFIIKHVDSDIDALDEQALCSFLTLVGVSGTDAEDVYYKKDLCSFFRYINVGVSETLDAISPGEGSLLCGGGLNFETMTVKINNCGYVKVFDNSREDEDELLETETKE